MSTPMPIVELTPFMDLCEETAKRLRQLREAMNLSRPKFADLLGIPPTTLKNYELGYREIGGFALLQIANHYALHQHTTWLMTGKNPVSPILTADDVSTLNP